MSSNRHIASACLRAKIIIAIFLFLEMISSAQGALCRLSICRVECCEGQYIDVEVELQNESDKHLYTFYPQGEVGSYLWDFEIELPDGETLTLTRAHDALWEYNRNRYSMRMLLGLEPGRRVRMFFSLNYWGLDASRVAEVMKKSQLRVRLVGDAEALSRLKDPHSARMYQESTPPLHTRVNNVVSPYVALRDGAALDLPTELPEAAVEATRTEYLYKLYAYDYWLRTMYSLLERGHKPELILYLQMLQRHGQHLSRWLGDASAIFPEIQESVRKSIRLFEERNYFGLPELERLFGIVK